MLYFFHHYELPVILQQAQIQQLLLRTHRGMAGMMGLAGIAEMASGAAYHDAPGTATQATPPTTQSTTQTVQNTAQSTTQTSPSVSTAQTNTTHTGDVVLIRPSDTNSPVTNSDVSFEAEDGALITSAEQARNADKDITNTSSADGAIKIEEIQRRHSTKAVEGNSNIEHNMLDVADGCSIIDGDIEPSTLDRRRKEIEMNNENPPLVESDDANKATERLASKASSDGEDLD